MWTLTESAASEWASDGVRVNAVAPGGVASSGFDTYEPDAQKEILKFPTRIPMQRYGTCRSVGRDHLPALASRGVHHGLVYSCRRRRPQCRPCWKELVAHDRSPTFRGFHRDVPPRLLVEGPKKQSSRG